MAGSAIYLYYTLLFLNNYSLILSLFNFIFADISSRIVLRSHRRSKNDRDAAKMPQAITDKLGGSEKGTTFA